MATPQQLFWSRLNQSVANFCLEVTQSRAEPENKIVSTLVGDELEWCGSHSFLFMASRYLSSVRRVHEMEQKLKVLEGSFSAEMQNVLQLRKQLKQAQLAAEDNDWQLQEQLAHASNILHLEKETNSELRTRLASSQAKLVEVEMFLNSEGGTFALQLEEALSAAKMRIAELEADKDDLELQIKNVKKHGSGIEKENQQHLAYQNPLNHAHASAPTISISGQYLNTTNLGQHTSAIVDPLPSSLGAPNFSFAGFASLLEE